jgi:hypothetical protein
VQAARSRNRKRTISRDRRAPRPPRPGQTGRYGAAPTWPAIRLGCTCAAVQCTVPQGRVPLGGAQVCVQLKLYSPSWRAPCRVGWVRRFTATGVTSMMGIYLRSFRPCICSLTSFRKSSPYFHDMVVRTQCSCHQQLNACRDSSARQPNCKEAKAIHHSSTHHRRIRIGCLTVPWHGPAAAGPHDRDAAHRIAQKSVLLGRLLLLQQAGTCWLWAVAAGTKQTSERSSSRRRSSVLVAERIFEGCAE